MVVRPLPPGSGKYKWVADYYDAGGRRHQVRKRTRREAEKVIERAAQARSGGAALTPRLTFGGYAPQALKDYAARLNLKPASLEGYESLLETHLLPGFRAVRMEDFLAAGLGLAAGLEKALREAGRARGTRCHAVTALNAVMEQAVFEGVFLANPIREFRVPRDKRVPSPEDSGEAFAPLDEAGALAYCAKAMELYPLPMPRQWAEEGRRRRRSRSRREGAPAQAPRRANPPWGVILSLMVWTGLRRGEMAGHLWGDLTLEGAATEVRVRRQWQGRKGFKGFVSPKSPKAVREVPLTPHALGLYRQWRAVSTSNHPPNTSPAEGGRKGAWLEARVFPFHPDNLAKRHLEVLEALNAGRAEAEKVPPFELHGLRDCFATLMIARGVELKELQRLMGHESIQTTEKHYTRHSRDAQARTRKIMAGG